MTDPGENMLVVGDTKLGKVCGGDAISADIDLGIRSRGGVVTRVRVAAGLLIFLLFWCKKQRQGEMLQP